jgi:acetate kinase
MRLLVCNAGSSSLKASLLELPASTTLWRTEVERAPGPDAWTDALRSVLAEAGAVDAVGHRVVHGGTRHTAPLLLDDEVLAELDALRDLAPLHNGPALEVIAAARAALPGVPQVACFDTGFHASLPPAAYVYPLPYAWYADWDLRRFGFHGLSVAWSVGRTTELLGRTVDALGLVVAHLGSGCSVTAVWEGRSVDTSMGMTPLEGLMMGTRAGSVDPGMLLELLDSGRVDRAELSSVLQRESGLLGVSGVSADLRDVEAAAGAGNERAALALELFARRAAAAVAAAATALPRLDAVVFTGGIGEHAASMRREICSRLGSLGVAADLSGADADAVLSDATARVQVLRIEAREDLVIAREVHRLLV